MEKTVTINGEELGDIWISLRFRATQAQKRGFGQKATRLLALANKLDVNGLESIIVEGE